MLDYLKSIDPHTAAGILANAAMRLEGLPEAFGHHIVDRQEQIEKSILEELRHSLGLDAEDLSRDAVERLTDALDEQAEILAGDTPEASPDRLSAEGLLPSDAYEIVYQSNLPENFKWRWEIESQLATQTVRWPHREQILVASKDDEAPNVTLFARYFAHKYPARSFWLLVAASREGRRLDVAVVWRIYPREVDLTQCETLLDVLQAFTDRFGHPVTLGGENAAFFYRVDSSEVPPERTFQFQMPGGRPEIVTVTAFHPPSQTGRYTFLLVATNLTRYLTQVENLHGWDKDILHDIVPTKLSAPFVGTQPTPG